MHVFVRYGLECGTRNRHSKFGPMQLAVQTPSRAYSQSIMNIITGWCFVVM